MSYWENRAKALQAYYDRRSAKTLRTVSQAYDRMVKQLYEDTERIIGNFAFYHGLTRDEAIALLKQPAPMSVLDDLRQRLDTITDRRMWQMVEARLNAPAYAARINRLQAIRESARVNAVQAADVERTVGQVHLRDVLFEGYQRTMFDIQQYTGLGFGFAGVDSRRMNQILRYNWSGKQFSVRVWANANVTARNLSQALTEVIMQGKTSRQTFDALMEEANGSRFAANRLLRTETNYISNQATAEAYADAGIERYKYMAVLDGRTSRMCQEKDGQEFLLSEKEVGVNYPPLHPWCRSSVEPVIDGISHEHMKRWARDPVTGEEMKVPRDMSYREWRAQQSRQYMRGFSSVDDDFDSSAGTLPKRIGEEHFKAINAIVDNADAVPASVWRQNQDQVMVINANYSGTPYHEPGRGIAVNIKTDALGTEISKPYGNTFHESWHFIDHKLGNGRDTLSISYQKGAFAKAIKSDMDNLVAQKRTPRPGSSFVPSVKDAHRSISRELMYSKTSGKALICDIMEAASKGKVETMLGHGAEYWKRPGAIEKEVFANLGEAAMTDKEAFDEIRKLFPATISKWLEMLGDVL